MSDPVAANSVPMSGAIPIGAGAASVLRIPVPGTAGLAVELRPKGWVPKGGSTLPYLSKISTVNITCVWITVLTSRLNPLITTGIKKRPTQTSASQITDRLAS